MGQPDDKKPGFYIDEHITIYEGREAEERLRAHSDLDAVDPKTGITRVELARWQEAQRYERRTWMERGQYVLSDRNEYHRVHFAAYEPLDGASFERGIELGCGPFTNMRLILEHCRVRHIHLLDPLLDDYLAHPFCRYRGGRLGGLAQVRARQIPAAARSAGQFLRESLNAYRIGGLFGTSVALEPSTIEAFQTSHRFDLLVMVNVIEHCQDIQAIFDKILQILEPGGTFVFHDVLYAAAEVRQTLSISYDAGHPLRVDQHVILGFLDAHFEPLMSATYWLEQEFRGVKLPRRELYYIGKRRATDQP
jgi:SAM-dependent methyltransferase